MDFIQNLHWSVWIVIPIVGLAIRDILQKRHTIQHNFPVIGHIRYMLEKIGLNYANISWPTIVKNYLSIEEKEPGYMLLPKRK
jgi:hypothetical protein